MKIIDGVNLHFIKTKKFKDIGIHIRFRNQLDEKSAVTRSLLALMMSDRCKKYDSKKKMNDILDQMYGASLQAQTAGYGSSQIIEIRSKIINPCYIEKNEQLLKSIFAFLQEVLFNPLIEDYVMEESRGILKAKIDRMLDDPAQYAVSKGLKIAGKGDYLGISALGNIENLMEVTLDDIKKAYTSMIENDVIDILICGDFDDEKMEKLVREYMPFQKRNALFSSYYKISNDKQEEVCKEYRNINQSSIMMVWFTNISIVDDDYYALRVANAIFGQYSTSLLFQEVREKNSLCYSIFSNLISYDGALGVTTGVDPESIEKAIQLIKKQFQRICEGDFEDSLITVSKQMIVNSLKASNDSMNSLIALQYQNELLQRNWTTEDIIEIVMNVNKDDILRAMKSCEQKLTFILTKEVAHEVCGE